MSVKTKISIIAGGLTLTAALVLSLACGASSLPFSDGNNAVESRAERQDLVARLQILNSRDESVENVCVKEVLAVVAYHEGGSAPFVRYDLSILRSIGEDYVISGLPPLVAEKAHLKIDWFPPEVDRYLWQLTVIGLKSREDSTPVERAVTEVPIEAKECY